MLTAKNADGPIVELLPVQIKLMRCKASMIKFADQYDPVNIAIHSIPFINAFFLRCYCPKHEFKPGHNYGQYS